MSYSEERFYQGQPGTSEGTLWTVPSTFNAVNGTVNVKRIIIKEIIFANNSSSNQAVSLSIVPSGGTAGNANRIVPATKLSANQTMRVGLSQVMYVGDFLSGLQANASQVTVTVSGVVRS